MTIMNVAIVGPAFFGYLNRIAGFMTSRGIPTRFYDEFPSNGILTKIILRYSPLSVRQYATRGYHEKITAEIIRSGATHVLFGTIEMFPLACIRRLSDHGVVMSRYAWDSVHNKPYAKTLDPYMLAVASFDPVDCELEGYMYIPLYSGIREVAPTDGGDIDFLYCATFHSNRPSVVTNIIDESLLENWKIELMLFFHSKKLWHLRYLFSPAVWHMGRLITTTPFSLDEIASMTARSRVVIDIHHDGQSGLTMRTFEALSLGAIVLTTNTIAREGLPPQLRDRVVTLDLRDVAGSMRKALARPRTDLTEEMRYYLSANRFIDQIIALLLGTEERAETRGVGTLAGCESEL
ncbi:MAG: glycosyltransferase family 1 protein [Sphingomonadales bacterium]|nr:glycosyltransferase family 1 protein [Sphingomonadales bacterium]